MKTRNRARAWALHVLYAWDSRGDVALTTVLDEFLDQRHIAPARQPYLKRVIEAIARHGDAVDTAIEESLTNWRVARLSAIDRNILRVAAAEMLHLSDIPARVSIQEALLLADRYGTDQSPRFINGVLDALMRRLERE